MEGEGEMIQVKIIVKDGKLGRSVDKKDISVKEISIIVYALEKVKSDLLKIEVKKEVDISTEDLND